MCAHTHWRWHLDEVYMTEFTPPRPKPAPTLPQERVDELEQLGFAPDSYRFQAIDAVRKTIARRMTDSFRDVPHFSLTIGLEIDALIAARVGLLRVLADGAPRPSINDVLIKAAALALKAQPAANASFTPEGVIFHEHADIAFAVAIEGGLITPIVRGAETKSLGEIAAATKDLAARAHTRRLKLDEYKGGTFTISNLGMFGIRSFTSVLNPPQGCILSVGAAETRAVWRGEAPARAQVLDVTLTCDHRSVDGATGARWLQEFRTLIDHPADWLA
jgi:pyruvate dehydrogenase E2 component (dihydrolipoamide acetyltransferase)